MAPTIIILVKYYVDGRVILLQNSHSNRKKAEIKLNDLKNDCIKKLFIYFYFIRKRL